MASFFEGLSLAIALAASAGSVYLSAGMGLKACPLCFYQRTFVFSALAVFLLSALGRSLLKPGVASLLALPMVLGGLVVAGFHVFLELRGVLECPKGVLGIGTAPAQSLAAFALLAATTAGGAVCGMRESGGFVLPLAGGAILGPLLAVGALVSSPKPPPAKDRPSVAQGYVLIECERPPATTR